MFYSYANKKSIKNPIGPLLDADGTLKTSNVDIAKTLNEFFLSAFTEENLSHIPRMEDLRNFTPDNILDSLEIYEEEVTFQIENLLANKSPGPDGLCPVHLKMLKDELVIPLTMIFNKSLQEGIVPKDFRMANITPIFKKVDRKMPNNYRPISLTSIVGKIFEAILTNRLVAHLEERNLLNSSQHQFKRNRSCLTNNFLI